MQLLTPCRKLFRVSYKSYKAILGKVDLVKEKHFVMAFKGSSTYYQTINETIRENFIQLAEEYLHYYGHSLGGCDGEDKISQLLDSSKVYRPEIGFGSTASRNGAMHAAPNDSSSRLLLLITAIEPS